MKTDINTTKPIVYYDGQCGFCSGFIKFLMKTSKAEQRICFLPYQLVSDTIPGELMMVDSATFFEAGKAAIKVLYYSRGIFRITAILLKLLPPKLIDKLYYLFARYRYQWFGQTSCAIN